jgi:hypothetical protein
MTTLPPKRTYRLSPDLQRKFDIYEIGVFNPKFRQCHAIKADGTRCRCQSGAYEVFCHSHLRHYGLFTMAVMAQVQAVSK